MKGYRPDPERTEVRVLRRHVPLRGAAILEIGCGDGRLTRRIAGMARRVVAVDSNPLHIARAKKLTPAALKSKIRFQIGTVETLRMPDHRFQIALLSWSL